MRNSTLKCGEKTVIGRGICEIQCEAPHAMETAVEYMRVDIWCVLYWIIELCHKTAEMHISLAGIAQLVSKQKWDVAISCS